MGSVFEELIRKFAEISQRDRRRTLHPARGDPPDGEPALHRRRRRARRSTGVVRTLYDPTAQARAACFSVADEHLRRPEPEGAPRRCSARS
jgi:hypothetical protein